MSDPDVFTCPTCEAINDICGCPAPPPPERAILLDLIAGLRAGYNWGTDSVEFVRLSADRAEARLREVVGDE